MREFPFMASVKLETSDAPYRLEIDATHAIRSNPWMTILSVWSLFLIPSRTEASLELAARLYHSSRLLKTYQAMGSYQSTAHLVFLPVSFRRQSIALRSKEDTFRDLFLQIQRDAEQLFLEAP